MRKRQDLALHFMQFNANITAEIIIQQGPDPGFDQSAVRVVGVPHARRCGQFKPHKRGIGRAQDGLMQIVRRFFDQPRDIRGAPGGLEPQGGADSKAALVGEKPKTDKLRDRQGGNDKQNQLNLQAAKKVGDRSDTCTSTDRL